MVTHAYLCEEHIHICVKKQTSGTPHNQIPFFFLCLYSPNTT